jgi:hypothetical protein
MPMMRLVRLQAAAVLVLAACNRAPLPASGYDAGPPNDGHDADVLASPSDGGAADLAGVDAFVPVPCGPSTPAFAGSLCGPAPLPCVALANETLPGSFPQMVDDRPVIAVGASGQPTIIVPSATVASATINWRDAGGTWHGTPIIPSVVAASLVRQGNALYAALSTGTFTESWAQWQGSAWQATETIPGKMVMLSHAVAADDASCFFVAGSNDQTNLLLGRRSGGTWTIGVGLSGGRTASEPPRVALSPRGRLHVVVALGPPTYEGLVWLAPPLGVEPLPADIPTSFEQGLEIGVTDDGELGRAHVLYLSNDTLRYATRPAAGGWSGSVIAKNQLAYCPSLQMGATCQLDEVHFIPFAVLTSGAGDVRLVYSRTETITHLVAQCMGQQCTWMPTGSSETAQVTLGWPSSTGVTSTVLATLPGGSRGDATVDATGTLHIVVWDGGGHVHYLSFSGS